MGSLFVFLDKFVFRRAATEGSVSWLKNHKLKEPSENQNILPGLLDDVLSVAGVGGILGNSVFVEFVFES